MTRVVPSVYVRRMPASPIVRAHYEDLIERFGEPDGSWTFDDAPGAKPTWPARIDVLHWADDEDLDINTFATVGMCDRPMQGVDHRCELHFSIRSRADNLEIGKIAAFCANLALYPFEHGTFFDWTQAVISPGAIPHFPNCCCVMLHPAFHEDGWDESVYDAVKVKIMNVVPLTPNEMAHRKKHGPFSIYDYFIEHEVDLFSDTRR